MKKINLILFLLLLFTACGTKNNEPVEEISKEEAIVKVEEKNENEKIKEEKLSSDGVRITEYEDGYTSMLSPVGEMVIVRKPEAYDYTSFPDYVLSELPAGTGTEFNQDLRSKDVTNIDLSYKLDYLLEADFDDNTKWPDSLPKEFDIEKIMEYGKDPGFGVRELHKQGINGEGVGIAIIDGSLLVDHVEYKDRLKLYEEIHMHPQTNTSEMHGPAVASIAVGKNIGVAPMADLYYIAVTHGVYNEGSFDFDLYWFGKVIDRVIEINKTLPEDRKIRVISISFGLGGSGLKNEDLAMEAVERAKEEGIYTITVSQSMGGLGRNPLGDPNDINSYTKGYFWRDSPAPGFIDRTMAPMDSRCLASPTGEDKYVFYYSGGMSWAVPYTAGLYALCCQVNPEITSEEFERLALETADDVQLTGEGIKRKIVNPKALIEEVKKIKE